MKKRLFLFYAVCFIGILTGILGLFNIVYQKTDLNRVYLDSFSFENYGLSHTGQTVFGKTGSLTFSTSGFSQLPAFDKQIFTLLKQGHTPVLSDSEGVPLSRLSKNGYHIKYGYVNTDSQYISVAVMDSKKGNSLCITYSCSKQSEDALLFEKIIDSVVFF